MKLNWVERVLANNPFRAALQRGEIQILKRKLPLKKGAKILEVGCGRGAGARLILKAFQPSLMCALDLDILMVQKAKVYLSTDERKRVSLHVGDVFRLPFKDNVLDAVFGFGVLHHVLNWRGAAAEIARVLKIGGIYFVEEFYPSAYQNFITKHLLVHPEEDRFFSHDLRNALMEIKLPIKEAIDFKKLGIVAVAVKEVSSKQ
ncbi:MAG: class I SAM-dependent methyltransferase [Desulfobacteraceae bacterium]|jgi:ubiquinone/menaquinone biosynthesis C-methylase UbiE